MSVIRLLIQPTPTETCKRNYMQKLELHCGGISTQIVKEVNGLNFVSLKLWISFCNQWTIFPSHYSLVAVFPPIVIQTQFISLLIKFSGAHAHHFLNVNWFLDSYTHTFIHISQIKVLKMRPSWSIEYSICVTWHFETGKIKWTSNLMRRPIPIEILIIWFN